MKSKREEPAFVFDLGGVLIDWNPRHLYRQLFDADEPAMERFLSDVCSPAWNVQQDAGRPFAEAVEELVLSHPQHEPLIRAFHERWPETLGGAIEGTVELLAGLKAHGYPLFALSNWSAETFHHARARFGFLEWFDQIVISGEAKLVKPDPRIFDVLLERAGRPAEACLFIDDTEANIVSARRRGFDALLFTTPEALRAELVRRGILD
jgi:2-haloacid dehalogenase